MNDLSSSLQEYHEKWNHMMQNSDNKLDKWVFCALNKLGFMDLSLQCYVCKSTIHDVGQNSPFSQNPLVDPIIYYQQ